MEKMGRDGRHRLPVLTSDNKFANVISQSDLCLFLRENMSNLAPQALSCTVEKIMVTSLCKVSNHAAIAEALWLFRTRKLLCLAVEDSQGGFVAPLSAKDFVFRASDLDIFGMAVDEFLASAPAPLVSCVLPATTTVGDALVFLAANKLYRFFVAGEPIPGSKREPVCGVVCLRDIIKHLSASMR